jgi:hypothetical protein
MYPDTIELPEAEDFCRGVSKNTRGQCCFLGWKRELFPNLTWTESSKFNKLSVTVAMEMHMLPRDDYVRTPSYNDDKRNTKKKLAEWFAKTVERLGYDIT